jgi:hypothetical protein
MIVTVDSVNTASGAVVTLRCPSCRQLGTFELLGHDLALSGPGRRSLHAGQRRCPNQPCHAHVFFIKDGNTLLASYPAEKLDFDATSIPPSVLAALEEAITCHSAGCYIAAAIMVRKTLEELCSDRGASGPNLKERIRALGSKVVLPTELLDGLDDLRLLGNDAAHIESNTYNQIAQEEVEVGIEFTKEVLKAVYQYTALLSRLRALKKTP